MNGYPTLNRGVVPLLAFAVLTATWDVYGGNQLQVLSPQSLAAISFSLAAAFFLGLQVMRRGLIEPFSAFRSQRLNVVVLNVTTSVAWLTPFYALKYLEPAVVNVIGLALMPALVILLGPLLRRGRTLLLVEVGAAVGVSILLGVLVWGSFTGRSGVGDIPVEEAAIGALFAGLSAVGATANIFYMKRLSEAGCDPSSVLAVRFLLLIAVAWSLTLVSDRPQLAEALVPGGIIALVGVGLPIYLLQVGIKYVEPISASLLISLSPLFAYALQFFDGRLRPSALTLLAIAGILLLVSVGTLARGR